MICPPALLLFISPQLITHTLAGDEVPPDGGAETDRPVPSVLERDKGAEQEA